MNEIITVLDNMRLKGNYNLPEGGVIIGNEWLKQTRNVIKKCALTTRITRKAIATAVQEKINLIITVIPPFFISEGLMKIHDIQYEFLKMIMQNDIAIYSLGKQWLWADYGGYDYFLKLLTYEYSTKEEVQYQNQIGTEEQLYGRVGEAKEKKTFEELLSVLKQFADQRCIFIGYTRTPVPKIAIFNEILHEKAIFEIKENLDIEALIVGDISYDALLLAQQIKLPLVILGNRVLENIIIGNIRRKILEELTIDLPELVTIKQDEIGSALQE